MIAPLFKRCLITLALLSSSCFFNEVNSQINIPRIWQRGEGTQKEYYLEKPNEEVNFHESKAFCESLARDGIPVTLPMIMNKEEQKVIEKLTGKDELWLGAYNPKKGDPSDKGQYYKWLNGHDVASQSFSNWGIAKDSGDQHPLANRDGVSLGGQDADYWFTNEYDFKRALIICERPIQTFRFDLIQANFDLVCKAASIKELVAQMTKQSINLDSKLGVLGAENMRNLNKINTKLDAEKALIEQSTQSVKSYIDKNNNKVLLEQVNERLKKIEINITDNFNGNVERKLDAFTLETQERLNKMERSQRRLNHRVGSIRREMRTNWRNMEIKMDASTIKTDEILSKLESNIDYLIDNCNLKIGKLLDKMDSLKPV